jgi:hypothetical protein
MNFVGTIEDKYEWLKSELPALEQLYAMGYEYKSQAELNKTRRDYREVLLYSRLEAAIRKINPELDEDGVYDALSKINENSFPYTLDIIETNEKIRAKLVGLSKTGGLEPITVTQNFGDGNVEKTVKQKELGFSTSFEFAIYEELKSLKNDDSTSKNISKAIFDMIKGETSIVGWKTKKSSEKRMSIIIYDILNEYKFKDDKVNELAQQFMELAK